GVTIGMKVNVMNQERYKRASQFFIFGIILTILVGIVTFIIHPELKNGAGDSLESTGLTKVLDYIKNNGILVPLQMFILAFIPIPFIYMANIVVTTIALGFFIGIALHLDVYQGVGLTISSLPHTFVEIFSYFFLSLILFDYYFTLLFYLYCYSFGFISRSRPNHFHFTTYICRDFCILFVSCAFI